MKKFAPTTVSIFVAILLIIIGYRLDYWIEILARNSRREFRGPLAWMAPAYSVDILMVSLLLAWLWFAHHNIQRNQVVSLCYVAVGAGLLIYTVVATYTSFSSPSFVIHFFVAPNSSASFACVFMIVFGLQRLIFGQSAI